mgnify:FL=1
MRVLKKILVLAAALLLTASSYAWAASLNDLRTSSTAEHDRLVFDFTEMPVYHVRLSEDERELTFDFDDTDAEAFRRIAVRTKRIDSVAYAARDGHFYVTVTLAKGMGYRIGNLTNPFRVFLDVAPKTAGQQPHVKPVTPPPAPYPPKQPAKTEAGDAQAQPETPKLPILKEEPIAAGLMQRTYIYEDEDGQVTSYFIEADPTRYSVRPALARGVIPGRQTVSGIAQDTNAVAAINASYFAVNGVILGVTKIDGMIVGTTYYDRSAFGVMPDGSFVFGTVSYDGAVKIDQVTLPVSGVNTERGENEVIIYNRAYGRSTGTNPYGLEYVIREGRVAEINTNDSAIPSDGYVVSVHGSSMDAFAAAGTRLGDPTVLTENMGSMWNSAVQIVGAGPRLVENGTVHVTAGEEQFPGDIRYGRAPRSAVGVTKEGKIVFAVVDGRQSHSHGLTLTEFAELLVKFGVQNAINLDGGGSSALCVRGSVVNSPSDGSERAVGSALILQQR